MPILGCFQELIIKVAVSSQQSAISFYGVYNGGFKLPKKRTTNFLNILVDLNHRIFS